jgi:MjaI restriction endonuclease.
MKITNQEIAELLVGAPQTFPKYSTQLINLANQNAQGTRPIIVGQMSDLIQQYPGKDFEGWKSWYTKQQPKAIQNATDKIYAKLLEMREVMDEIDKALVERWVRDLVITKTYSGLRFQEVILKKLADKEGKPYRLSTPIEESKGIDGFVGDAAVSIKPITYKVETALREHIEVRIIYYEKKKDGLVVTL